MKNFAIILCTLACATATLSMAVKSNQSRRDAMSDIVNEMKERRVKEKREIDARLDQSIEEIKEITESISDIAKSFDSDAVEEVVYINNTVAAELKRAKQEISFISGGDQGLDADECQELEGVHEITAVTVVTYANGCVLGITAQSTSLTEEIRQKAFAALKKLTTMRQESTDCIENIFQTKSGFKEIFQARECLREVKYAVDIATTDGVSGFAQEITKFKEDIDNLRNGLRVCAEQHGVSAIRETLKDITKALSICLTGHAE